MKRGLSALAAAVLLAGGLTGCDSPERRVDSASKAVAAFQAKPSPESEAAAEKAIADAQAAVDETERSGQTARLRELNANLAGVESDFQAARMAHAVSQARQAVEQFGSAIKNVGESLKDALAPQNGTNSTP